YLTPLGRITEAIHELDRSLKEDPLNPVCGIQLGVLNWSAGRYGEASRQFRHAQELDANLWLAWLVPALCYANEDRNEEALAMAERAYAVAPTNPLCSGVLAGLVSRGGDSERGEQLKRGVREGTAYGVPLGRAMYHHIRRGYEAGDPCVVRALEEHHPSALPHICLHARKHLIENGSWPTVSMMLRLPQTVAAELP